MRQISSISRCFLNYSFAVITTLSLFYSNQLKSQCAGVTVTPPTLDVRGSTNLCGGGRLEICPLIWGYSNYQWYKDGVAYSTASCIDITIAGSYTLAGQDGSGCWSSQSTQVVVTSGISPAVPTVAAGGATTFCSGGSVLLTSSAATGNQWNKDGIAIGGATDSIYSATASGVYTVSVSGCGISTSAGTTVTVNPAPVVSAITGSTTACVGGTITLVDTTLGGVWASTNTAIATVSGGVVTALTAGTDTITYTVTSGGCTTTVSQVITVSASTIPTLDVRGSTVLCGDSVEVCPLVWGYSNYQWYKNGVAYSTASCIRISTAGSYTLSGQNGSGCWSAQSAAVVITTGTAPVVPTVAAGGATTFCSGGSVVLTSSAATGNQWKKDGVAIGGATSTTYTATASGVYTVSVTACGTATSTGTTVTVSAAPVVASIGGNSTVCPGNTLTLSNTTAGGVWASSNTAIATVSAGIVNTLTAGIDTISYTVTNGTCATVVTKTITVFTAAIAPTISPRSTLTLCTGGSVQMCPLVWGYSNYQWYKDGVAYSTASCITTSAAGSYTLSGQNGSGCWSSQSAAAVVTMNPLPSVLASTGPSGVCVGSTITLSNATSTPIGGSSFWNSIAGLATVNASGVVTGNSHGTAIIAYNVVSAAGCRSAANYNVVVSAIPSTPTIGYAAPFSNPQQGAPYQGFCVGKVFGVAGSPSGGVWSANGCISVTSGGIATINTTGAGSLTYTFTNANGCSNFRTMTGAGYVCAARGIASNNNEQQTVKNQFSMYPNPAKSFVSLYVETLVGEGQIIVTDLYGKTVKTQPLSMGNNTVDIANFSKGFYLISTITNSGKTTKKLIVE